MLTVSKVCVIRVCVCVSCCHVSCTVQSARYICEYQDYLNFHLTGRMVASISNVSVRWHYNSNRGTYPPR